MRFRHLALLFAAVAVLRAHHWTEAAAKFDPANTITLTGKVSKLAWTNPHTLIQLDVASTIWELEGFPPNTLKRAGFPPDLLKVGDTVTVKALKAKDGSNTGAWREVTFPDGTRKSATSAR